MEIYQCLYFYKYDQWDDEFNLFKMADRKLILAPSDAVLRNSGPAVRYFNWNCLIESIIIESTEYMYHEHVKLINFWTAFIEVYAYAKFSIRAAHFASIHISNVQFHLKWQTKCWLHSWRLHYAKCKTNWFLLKMNNQAILIV